MVFKVLLHLLLFSLILGQFAKVMLGDISLYISDVMFLVIGSIGLAYLFFNGSLLISRYFLFHFVFIFICIISLVFNIEYYSISQHFNGIAYLLRFVFIIVVGVVLENALVLKSEKKTLGNPYKTQTTPKGESNYFSKHLSLEWFVQTLINYILIFCLLGFVQLIALPDFSVLAPELGWDPHKNRLASTFFDPNFAGAFILIGLLLVIYRIWLNNKAFVSDYLNLFTFGVAVVLTYSRSSWIMLAALLLVLGAKYKKILLLSLIVFLSAYIAVPRIQTRLVGITDPADSAHFRFISWEKAYRIFDENKIIGIGYNYYRYAQQNFGFIVAGESGGNSGAGSDSSFLLVLATTGIFGFAAFLVAFLFPIFKEKPDIILTSGFVGLGVHSQFVNSFFYPPILFFLLCLVVISNSLISRKLS